MQDLLTEYLRDWLGADRKVGCTTAAKARQ